MPQRSDIQEDIATGAGAIAHSLSAHGKAGTFAVRKITLKLGGNPTTSEAYTVTKNDKNGATYDSLHFTEDLSVGTVTTVVLYFGEEELVLQVDADGNQDSVDIAFANTETNTYGSVIEYESR